MKATLFTVLKTLLFASSLAVASAQSSACDICGGAVLANPSGVLVSLDGESTACQVIATANGLPPTVCAFSRAFEGLTCGELNGQVLDNDLCFVLPFIIGDTCGCGGLVPTPAPVAVTVSPAAGIADAIVSLLNAIIVAIQAVFGI